MSRLDINKNYPGSISVLDGDCIDEISFSSIYLHKRAPAALLGYCNLTKARKYLPAPWQVADLVLLADKKIVEMRKKIPTWILSVNEASTVIENYFAKVTFNAGETTDSESDGGSIADSTTTADDDDSTGDNDDGESDSDDEPRPRKKLKLGQEKRKRRKLKYKCKCGASIHCCQACDGGCGKKTKD